MQGPQQAFSADINLSQYWMRKYLQGMREVLKRILLV